MQGNNKASYKHVQYPSKISRYHSGQQLNKIESLLQLNGGSDTFMEPKGPSLPSQEAATELHLEPHGSSQLLLDNHTKLPT